MASPNLTIPVFEHHHNGLGLEAARPRISWRFQTSSDTVSGWQQTSYEVEVTFDADSGPETFSITSQESVLVPWPARSLASREAATVRIRVFGRSLTDKEFDAAKPSAWSDPATVEAALLEATDFEADFITTATPPSRDQGALSPIRFRKEFKLPDHVTPGSSARLYITSLGVFEAWLNGKPVSDECMAPGWTSYRHRLIYRTLDVSKLLVASENVLSVEVGEGWYAGRLGFRGGKRFFYGDELGLFAQLEVQGRSSEGFTVLSDDTWSSLPSPIMASGIYDGEIYDTRKDVAEWTEIGANLGTINVVGTRVLPRPSAKLVSPDIPPVRVTEVKPCIGIQDSKSGKCILDFGQNLVGKLRIKSVQLAEGETVTFRHAEVMEDSELGTRPLRDAKARDTLIGSGKTIQNWTPKFTFHGFRFVEVVGWPGGKLKKDDIEALVMHTNMKRRGFFECSNDSVNQLHKNVVWSMRGNFLSLPTDCPQRDERLGWTGDLQVFCPTATFLYDTMGILGSWLEDVAAEQLEEGARGIPPLVVPDVINGKWPHIAQAVWDDVCVLTPGVLYEYSSDAGLLEKQFTSMHTWLDKGVDRASDGLWNPDKWQLSDWLDPSAPPEDPGNARTDNILVANAYLIHTTIVFSRLCKVLGKTELADKYAKDAERLKALFQRRYITAEGNLMSTTQTGISLAFQFGLYPDDTAQKQVAAKALEKLVRTARFNISTGFAGTPVVTHALTTIGQPQLAYRMLLETKCPSWLFPIVRMDATTIWERWDSMLPDGRINPGQMTSFNHYALGAIADWLHTTVGGIAPLESGWRKIRVRPVPGGNLTSANVKFDGPYGLVACEWRLDGEKFKMHVEVPPSCSAEVVLPTSLDHGLGGAEEKPVVVHAGSHDFECVCKLAEWPPKPMIAANQQMPPDTIAT